MLRSKTVLSIFSLFLTGCVMLTPSEPHASATGRISGYVLDSHDRPVAGAEVWASYMRGWTTFMPPVPNAFIVGIACTDSQGRFQITTSKRVDQLAARAERRGGRGEITNVKNQGNV